MKMFRIQLWALVILSLAITAGLWWLAPTPVAIIIGTTGIGASFGGRGGLLLAPYLLSVLALIFSMRDARPKHHPWPLTVATTANERHDLLVLAGCLIVSVCLQLHLIGWL